VIEPRFDTLVAMLEGRGRSDADRVAFTFETGAAAEEGGWAVTFGELHRRLTDFAAGLLHRGLERGERVVIALPNGPEFFVAFYGVQRAGGVAVPIFPASGAERILALAGLCGARSAVLPSDGDPEVAAAVADGVAVVRVSEVASSEPPAAFPEVRAGDLAYLQYTSGSTGDPKGVELCHRNLLVNVEQLIAGMGITPGEVFVSWLPVFHDMGLVLLTMVPFYLGARLHLLPTTLADTRRWLRTIERRRGTFTAAPDFAYRLCLRQVKDPGRHDLSSLRVALDAAEPVRARTLADFERAFDLGGVMAPGYGLAEATVGVATWPPGRPVKVDDRGFVSVGPPFPEVEVEIVGEAGPAPAGEVGEIAVRSPANTRGYHRNPEATARLLRGDGFLLTGDLGYRDRDGDLFIVGRKKNVILHGGRNLSPQELEEVVDQLPFVRLSAAVGIDRGRLEGEQAYLFAEVRPRGRRSEDELARMASEVARRCHRHLGVRPGRVYLLRPRVIPRTANGKTQHALLRRRHLEGELRREGSVLFPDY